MEKEEREKERTFPQKVFPSRIWLLHNRLNIIHDGIFLIREYKNSLISKVVTGKVDVRNIVVEAVSPEDLAPSDDPDESEEQDSPVSEESEE